MHRTYSVSAGRSLLPMLVFLFGLPFALGCQPTPQEWTPDDKSIITDVIANISETRTAPEKAAELFAKDSVPDKAWLESTRQMSFVIEDIEIDKDMANVTVVLENHFGEPQGTTTWTCQRSGDSWVVASSPLPAGGN